MNFLYILRFYMRSGWTVLNATKRAWKVSRNK
jgi:hypothetical protein